MWPKMRLDLAQTWSHTATGLSIKIGIVERWHWWAGPASWQKRYFMNVWKVTSPIASVSRWSGMTGISTRRTWRSAPKKTMRIQTCRISSWRWRHRKIQNFVDVSRTFATGHPHTSRLQQSCLSPQFLLPHSRNWLPLSSEDFFGNKAAILDLWTQFQISKQVSVKICYERYLQKQFISLVSILLSVILSQ